MDLLAGKSITVMVSGGIAAYKAADLVSRLVKRDAQVRVVMTANACEFITPLTMRTLSQHKVYLDMFDAAEVQVTHITLAQTSDAIIIVPATANVIGKIAGGLADDLLTTTVLAAVCPVLVCPAMNVHMYENSIVQENLKKLQQHGYLLVEPAAGRLACGTSGKGRLPEPAALLEQLEKLFVPQDWQGLRLLLTAGPTREELDPVRYLSNYSSGKMGCALARQAVRRGAQVTLVHGPLACPLPLVPEAVAVSSAGEMREAVENCLDQNDVIIMAAAVADYRPQVRAGQKIKKAAAADMTLPLVQNPDILAELGRRKTTAQTLVGFAAESENLTANARQKLLQKNLDLIVANDITAADSGFNADHNLAQLLLADGTCRTLPKLAKDDLANIILDTILEIRGG